MDEKKVKEASSIDLNLEHLKIALNKQFDYLRSLVSKTDKSFEGAVNAQEKKQINGINKLEKRLLKAQMQTAEAMNFQVAVSRGEKDWSWVEKASNTVKRGIKRYTGQEESEEL